MLLLSLEPVALDSKVLSYCVDFSLDVLLSFFTPFPHHSLTVSVKIIAIASQQVSFLRVLLSSDLTIQPQISP